VVGEGHLVDARDATGVEVVLEVGRFLGVEADDRDAVRCVGVVGCLPYSD
jgi:hypothetical protein